MVEIRTQRATELRGLLRDHEHRVHVLEHPVLSEPEAARMTAELVQLEEGGVPRSASSPTRRRPAPPRERFQLVPHRGPWPEPTPVHSVAELKAFHQRTSAHEPDATYVATATMGSVDVALTYTGGILERAVLRADGVQGEDVTDNVRTLPSVPLELRPPGSITESRITKLTRQALGPATLSPVPPFPQDLTIRVTIAMRSADLTALDRRRVDAGDPPYILPRGAILGTLRRLDPRITASRRLKVMATGCDAMPSGIDSEWQLLGALKSWGFSVQPVTWRCKGLQEVLDFVSTLQQIAPTFEFPLEGGLLSVNRFDLSARVEGPTAVRLVFPTPGRAAVVSKVYHAVGRGGSILPVALLSRSPEHDLPVPERAPLPAADGDAMLAVEPGTEVRVRPGSVAPILMPDDLPARRDEIDRCPACGSTTVSAADEPFERCVNSACVGRARARLLHLIGPRGLRLASVTVRTVDRLLADHGALDAADILLFDPGEIDRVAPGQGAVFAQEIRRAGSLPLWRLLYLAAIPHVSEHSARAIAHHVHDVERLRRLTPAECSEIADIPPEAAEGLAGWIAKEAGRLLSRLLSAGYVIEDGSESFAAPFLGRNVVVAGELDLGGVHAADEIERRGGTIQTRVGRLTDFVVVGKKAEREFDAAAMYGITVIDEFALGKVLEETSGR